MSTTLPCPRCAADIPHDGRTCSACGYELADGSSVSGGSESTCRECGGTIRPGMIRCRECGTFVRSAPGSEEAETRGRSTSDTDDRLPDADPETHARLSRDGTRQPLLRRFGLPGAGFVLVVATFAIMFGRESRPPEFAGRLTGLPGPLTMVAYSDEGRFLAAGNTRGEISVWALDADTRGRPLAQFSSNDDTSVATPIVALAISPDGYLIAADSDRNLVGWQIDGAEPQAISRLKSIVTCVAMRSTGSGSMPEAVLGLKDGKLAFLRDEQTEMVAAGHKGYPKTVAYDLAGKWLVTGGTDGRVIWRDADSRDVVHIRQPHTSEVAALEFSSDGRLLATGDWDGTVCVWNVATREIIAEWQQPDAVSGIGFTSDGLGLATGSWDGYLRFWTTKNWQLAQFIDTGGPIHALAVAPNGKTVATASDRSQVELWQLR